MVKKRKQIIASTKIRCNIEFVLQDRNGYRQVHSDANGILREICFLVYTILSRWNFSNIFHKKNVFEKAEQNGFSKIYQF